MYTRRFPFRRRSQIEAPVVTRTSHCSRGCGRRGWTDRRIGRRSLARSTHRDVFDNGVSLTTVQWTRENSSPANKMDSQSGTRPINAPATAAATIPGY